MFIVNRWDQFQTRDTSERVDWRVTAAVGQRSGCHVTPQSHLPPVVSLVGYHLHHGGTPPLLLNTAPSGLGGGTEELAASSRLALCCGHVGVTVSRSCHLQAD